MALAESTKRRHVCHTLNWYVRQDELVEHLIWEDSILWQAVSTGHKQRGRASTAEFNMLVYFLVLSL